MIKGKVGKENNSFKLSNLSSLVTLEIGNEAFQECHSIVFESMNDWMNDEWDLTRLQSIILGSYCLYGDRSTVESNELIMKSMNDNDDWLIRSSFPLYIQRSWQLRFYRQSEIGEWWLTTEFELDIPSLTDEGIQIRYDAFIKVRELTCSSMIDGLIMIEMLILLNTISLRIVMWFLLNTCYLFIHQYSGYGESIKCNRFLDLLNRLWFKEE